MKTENITVHEKLKTKDKFNDLLQSEKKIMEDNLNSKLNEYQEKLEEKTRQYKDLHDKHEKVEKDFRELVIKIKIKISKKNLLFKCHFKNLKLKF